MSEAALLSAAPHPLGELTALAERIGHAVVRVSDSGRRGGGSGVVWSAAGLVISNAHVVHGGEARLELRDGSRLAARVVARDRMRDLIALRTDRGGLPSVEAGDAVRLRPGELVFALGNPDGAPGALSWGVVHTLDRYGSTGVLRWVRTDLALAPGNSGGPLVNAAGRVVGINARIQGGAGLAIPVSAVAAFLERGGDGPPLGLRVRPVRVLGLPDPGAGLLVLSVVAASAAASAGLQAGDVVVGIGGDPVQEPADLRVVAGEVHPGEAVALEVLREGRRLVLRMRAPNRPAATAA